MNVSESSLSIKSSLLNDDLLKKRRQNEHFAIFLGVIAQFIWAINSIQLKTYQKFFPECYSDNSLVFLRSVTICLCGYLFTKKEGVEITPVSTIKHKFWFFASTAGNYLSIYFWVVFLSYFRVSTCTCISGCSPVFVLILSYFILKETFYLRYFIGIIICIIGTGIMVSNEKKQDSENNEEMSLSSLILGCIIGFLIIVINSFWSFGQKIVCKKINEHVLNYYLGLYNALPALVMMILENHFGFTNIGYVLYGLSNGLVFYSANYCNVKALEYIAISKFIVLTYLCTVFIFIFGFLILNEKVFFTDIIGSFIILGFQVYNVSIATK